MSARVFAGSLACLFLSSAVPAAKAQFAPVEIKIKYICMSKDRSWSSSGGGEKHYCWDGKHYSKSTGGVPAFILEYWAEQERESARFSEELKRNSEEMAAKAAASRAAAEESRRAAGLPTFEEARRAAEERHRASMEKLGYRSGVSTRSTSPAAGVATVEQSQQPTHEPLPLDRFNGLNPGAERAAVVETLGAPHGSMSNLGSNGDEESLTYLVEGGGQASIRFKQGKLLNIRVPRP